MKEESFYTVGNPLTVRSVGSFEISEDNIKYKQTNKEHMPKRNCGKITFPQKALT